MEIQRILDYIKHTHLNQIYRLAKVDHPELRDKILRFKEIEENLMNFELFLYHQMYGSLEIFWVNQEVEHLTIDLDLDKENLSVMEENYSWLSSIGTNYHSDYVLLLYEIYYALYNNKPTFHPEKLEIKFISKEDKNFFQLSYDYYEQNLDLILMVEIVNYSEDKYQPIYLYKNNKMTTFPEYDKYAKYFLLNQVNISKCLFVKDISKKIYQIKDFIKEFILNHL